MFRIMFFAHDPGGANAINPLIKTFESKNYEVFKYAAGPAEKIIFSARHLEISEIHVVLNEIKPDFIITGTSSNDFTEKLIWTTADKIGIPTMAILDHWCNYGIRFSKYSLKDIKKYNSDRAFDFLPQYICVMDDFAKIEMQKEGIPKDMILPLGNPHFQRIKKKSEIVDIPKIRSKFLKNDNEKLIIFASEPYEEDYGIASAPERESLNDILKVISKREDITLVVKLHPKESENKYQKKDCNFDKETAAIDLIMASDLVISMTSMFLIEAVVLGKKSLSYQPNENDRTKFILTRNQILPFINNPEDLKTMLNYMLDTNKETLINFPIDFNAIENILNFVEEVIR